MISRCRTAVPATPLAGRALFDPRLPATLRNRGIGRLFDFDACVREAEEAERVLLMMPDGGGGRVRLQDKNTM